MECVLLEAWKAPARTFGPSTSHVGSRCEPAKLSKTGTWPRFFVSGGDSITSDGTHAEMHRLVEGRVPERPRRVVNCTARWGSKRTAPISGPPLTARRRFHPDFEGARSGVDDCFQQHSCLGRELTWQGLLECLQRRFRIHMSDKATKACILCQDP